MYRLPAAVRPRLRGLRVGDLPLESLEAWPHTLWEPADCPLCVRGVQLEDAGQ